MGASHILGDVHQPLAVGEAEAEETLEAEVVIETTARVPWVTPDHRVQVEVELDPKVLKRICLKWKAKTLASTVAKMDTKYVTVSKILTTNASTADNLDTSHEIAMSVKNLKDEAEAEADLGKAAAEDEDVALFREGEVVKVEIIWERQLCLTLPRKKILLRC